MMPVPSFDPAAFDPASTEFRRDPYPFYAQFRQHAPVAYVGRYKAWWVFSHALVKEVCERNDLFLKRPQPDPAKRGPEGLFFMDPPRHTAVRSRLDKLFKAAIEPSPAQARSLADGLLSGASGRFDLITAYAKPLPRQVFMALMGIAAADWQAFGDRIDELLDGHDLLASESDRHAAGEAQAFLEHGFGTIMEQRCPASTDPGLLCAMKREDAPAPLSMTLDERVKTAINFALAGYLSSEFLIGTGLYHLLSRPQQWQRLREATLKEGRTAVDRAVQEMLRYDAPFQLADRYAAKETVLGGVTIPALAQVTVVYGSANRDEEVFGPDADEFDVCREPRPSVDWGAFGLSHGIHRCIGEPLIRDTLPITFEALLRLKPGLVPDGEPTWRGDPYFRSIRRLPVSD